MDYTTVAFCFPDEKHGKIAQVIRKSSAKAWSLARFDNSDLCYTVQDKHTIAPGGRSVFSVFLLN